MPTKHYKFKRISLIHISMANNGIFYQRFAKPMQLCTFGIDYFYHLTYFYILGAFCSFNRNLLCWAVQFAINKKVQLRDDTPINRAII